MTRSRIQTWLVCCLATFALASCSSDTTSTESTGALSLNLELAPGIEINEVDWTITSPGMDPMDGTINTSAPGSTASVEVFGLPPGDDYNVELEATSEDGETTCRGDADFEVEVGETTDIMVFLNCKRPETLGGVRVNGKFNICAELAKVVVSPLQTSVGNDIDLSAQTVDVEGDDVAIMWSATGGSIDNPSAAETTYTCAVVGDHEIMVRVSDDGFDECTHGWTVAVTCVEGDGLECVEDADCDAGEVCEDNICVPDVECNIDDDCDAGEVCEDNVCVPDVECNIDDDCGVEEICVANACVSDPDLFCNENLCATNETAKENCVQAFLTCLAAEPFNEEECILVGLVECSGECLIDLDCPAGDECTAAACVEGTCETSNLPDGTDCADDTGMCSDGICIDNCEDVVCEDIECNVTGCNPFTGECDAVPVEDGTLCDGGTCQAGVCEPTGDIPLPMVVDDHYFGRSGFSDAGAPLHTEDNECPERAGGEAGVCHRFEWNGTGGVFTGTFWTDGEGFVDLNGLPVEGGATKVSFWAWGAVGGEVIEFGAGLGEPQWDGAADRQVITLTTTPTLYTVALANLAGYTDVYGPFIWAANNDLNPSGFEFYVDDIQWVSSPVIPLPMVVDDNYFDRSAFGDGGPPLHAEDNMCPERAGDEDGLCHRFTWDGTGGGFTGTFWTSGSEFTDLNGLLVEMGATEVSFWAWGASGGELIEFGAGLGDPQWDGAQVREFIELTTTPTQYNVSLAALAGYSAVYGPFIVAASNGPNPSGVEFYVDDIKWVADDGGGGELTTNGDFETGDFTGWTNFCDNGAASCTITTDNPNGGTFAARLEQPTPAQNVVIKQERIAAGEVATGDTIAVTFSLRGSVGVGGVVFLELFTEETGGNVVQEGIVGFTPTTDWVEISETFTLTGNPGDGITVQIAGVTGGDAASFVDAYVDDVSAVKQ